MKHLALLIALTLPSAAFADTHILMDAYTVHTEPCRVSNNPKVCEPWKQPTRISLQYDLTDGITAGLGYGNNSYGRPSTSAEVLWQPIHLGMVKTGLWAAAVSGYSCKELKTCAIVGGLSATVDTPTGQLQLLLVPAMCSQCTWVTQIRMGVKF